jgi:succinate dehydrogenase/fumarate reductase flavoprotein subunit
MIRNTKLNQKNMKNSKFNLFHENRLVFMAGPEGSNDKPVVKDTKEYTKKEIADNAVKTMTEKVKSLSAEMDKTFKDNPETKKTEEILNELKTNVANLKERTNSNDTQFNNVKLEITKDTLASIAKFEPKTETTNIAADKQQKINKAKLKKQEENLIS